jgi:lipopolysaccharide export system protein LptA
MKRLATLLVTAATVCAAAGPIAGSARAQIAASNAPIDVTADQLEMVDSQHLAIWRGNVEAVQEDKRLVSDVLNVYFAGKSTAPGAPKPKPVATGAAGGTAVGADWGAVDHMIADGHVFFVSPDQTARGEHAVYDMVPDTITMTGDVVVVQGDNVIKGDKLVIEVKTGHANIISNATGRNKPERVRGVFYNNGQNCPPAPAGSTAPAKCPPAKPARASGTIAAPAPGAPATAAQP